MGFFDSLKNAVNQFGEKMVETNDEVVGEWVKKYQYKTEYELKGIANSDIESGYKAWQIQAARYILVTEYGYDAFFDGSKNDDVLIVRKYSIKNR